MRSSSNSGVADQGTLPRKTVLEGGLRVELNGDEVRGARSDRAGGSPARRTSEVRESMSSVSLDAASASSGLSKTTKANLDERKPRQEKAECERRRPTYPRDLPIGLRAMRTLSTPSTTSSALRTSSWSHSLSTFQLRPPTKTVRACSSALAAASASTGSEFEASSSGASGDSAESALVAASASVGLEVESVSRVGLGSSARKRVVERRRKDLRGRGSEEISQHGGSRARRRFGGGVPSDR